MNQFTIADTVNDLDTDSRRLIEQAEDALIHAYAPYSKFSVSAAILLDNHEVVTGTNQENAAYPDCMCAERVALYAVASRYPGIGIKKLAVVARNGNAMALVPASCCGSCRQVMVEFEQRQNKAFEIVMQNEEHKWVKAKSAASLLPFGFTKSNLNISGSI